MANTNTVNIAFRTDGAGKIVTDTGKVTGATKRMGDSAKKAGTSMSSLAGKLKGLAVMLAAGFGIKQAISSAVEFKHSIMEVSTLVDTSTVSMARYEEEIKSLAVEVGQSTQDLTKGLYQVISAGVATEDAMTILAASAKVAVAGITTTEKAVLALTKALNIYGLEASQVTFISDLFFKTVERGQITFPELASQVGRILPFARALGVEMEDALAVFAGMTTVLGRAEQAATALEATFRAFITSGQKFRDIGIDIRKVLAEEGLVGALKRLKEVTGGDAEKLRELGIETEALRGVLGLFGGKLEDVERNLKEMEVAAGSAGKAFRKMAMGAHFAMAVIRARFDVFAAEAGKTFLPIIEQILKSGISVLDAFSALWAVLSSFPLGVIEFFRNLRTEMEKTREEADQFADPTPFEELWAFLGRWGKDTLAVFTHFGKSTANAFAVMVIDIIAILNGLINVSKPIGEVLVGIFTLDSERIKKGWADWKDTAADTVADLYSIAAAGFKGIGDSYDDMIKKMQKTRGLPEIVGAVTREVKTLEKTMAAIRKEADAFVKDVYGSLKSTEEIRLLDASIQAAIDKMTLSQQELILKQAEAWRKAGADQIKIQQWVNLELKKLDDARLEDIKKLNAGIQDMIDQMTLSQRELVSKQAEAWKEAGADRVLIQEWVNLELKKLDDERLKDVEKFADAIVKELWGTYDTVEKKTEELGRTTEDVFAMMRYDAGTTANNLVYSFETMFFDGFKNGLDSLLDYFKRFLVRLASTALAQRIIIPVQTALTGAGTTGAGVSGMGKLAGFMPFLGAGMVGAGIGTMLGDSTGNMIGGAIGSMLASTAFAQSMLAGVVATVGTSLGLTFAVSGAILGPIGIAIGALLGSIIGKLFSGKDKIPSTELVYRPEDQYAEPGFWVKGIEEMGEEFSNAVIPAMDTLRSELMDFVESIGGDLSKFYEKFLTGSTELDKDLNLEQLLKKWAGQYAEFVTQIDFTQFQKSGEDLVDTIDRIISSVTAFDDVMESFDNYISAIQDQYDAIALWKDQMTAADEQINELKDSLRETTDPADALNYASQLKQAIYDKYLMEKQFVENLAASIEQLKVEMVNFTISMQQKISGLTGDFTALIETITLAAFQTMGGSQKLLQPGAFKSLADLQQFIGYLDQWLAANIAAIQKSYQARIAALQSEKEAIQEAYEARTDALREELDLLQEQLEVARAWEGVLNQVKDLIFNLTTSTASPADIFERLNFARSEMDRIKALYEAEADPLKKAEYSSQLANLIQEYLGLAQEAFQRPSPEYQAIYGEMIGWLEELQTYAREHGGNIESIEEQIKNINEEMKAIQEAMRDQLESIDAEIKSLNDQMNAEIEAFKEASVKYYEWAMNEGIRLYQEKIDDLSEKLGDILGDKTMEEYLADLQLAAVTELIYIRDLLANIFANLFPNMPVPEYQSGGLVGRTGLAYVHQGETVIPAGQSAGAGNTTIQFNQTININDTKDLDEEKIAELSAEEVIRQLKYDKGRALVQDIVARR